MSEDFNLSELCRLCSLKGSQHMHIFDKEAEQRQLLFKIRSCVPAVISKEDALPKNICQRCVYKLDMFYEFRVSCMTTETVLKNYADSLKNLAASVNHQQTANMSSEDLNAWRNSTFRQNMIAKIEESIQQFQIPMIKNASEMENHVYMKAKTKEEYLTLGARLILHLSQMNNKKPPGAILSGSNSASPGVQQGMPDPIGALQTLARQGTGNTSNLAMQAVNQNAQNMVSPQTPGVNNANLLQSLNQRPGQPMSIPGMHNKMGGLGMVTGQPGAPMPMPINQMSQMSSNPMMAQMTQMNQGTMGQVIGPPPQQMSGVQMNVAQMGPNQMQTIQNQMQSQMSGHQFGGSMNAGLQTAPSPQGPSQSLMNTINTSQIAPNQLSQSQLGHLQRKPGEMMNAGYQGSRNIAPNQFLGQSPPAAASPGSLGAHALISQMVPSPAVSSPNPQLGGAQRPISLAPSPSSSLATPASVLGATASPLQDDQMSQAYKEKVRKLSKYIEPLRRLILKMTNEGNIEKTSKMKKLLEILTNPSSSTKLDVLQKCEVALEKMDFKRLESVGPVPSSLKEHHFFTPLLEVVHQLLQSPVANHTLHRTFGPCLEALFGPDIENLLPPLKKPKTEESSCEIPDVLQAEIARLDQRFKVSLDPAQQSGSKCIQLICWLDDKHLPCVPPVMVTVPADYPSVPPRCVLTSHEYATPYLSAVQEALEARLSKLPKRYSISQLLDTWEMSVRQASAPKAAPQSQNLLQGEEEQQSQSSQAQKQYQDNVSVKSNVAATTTTATSIPTTIAVAVSNGMSTTTSITTMAGA